MSTVRALIQNRIRHFAAALSASQCAARCVRPSRQYPHNHGVSESIHAVAGTPGWTTLIGSPCGCGAAGYYHGYMGKYLNG
jgi:hypothetical protein